MLSVRDHILYIIKMSVIYPAEGYGIKYEGSFLGEKSESGCFQNCFHFFVSTTFGHNLHRIELKICGCDLSMV